MHIDHIINQNYRDLETDAATAQWDVRPGSLLECSRQDVGPQRSQKDIFVRQHAEKHFVFYNKQMSSRMDRTFPTSGSGGQVISCQQRQGLPGLLSHSEVRRVFVKQHEEQHFLQQKKVSPTGPPKDRYQSLRFENCVIQKNKTSCLGSDKPRHVHKVVPWEPSLEHLMTR